MTTRPAAVAGAFYPAAAAALRADVQAQLAGAGAPSGAAAPKAVIAPHAGYVYSGPIAASAYARLAGQHNAIRRVVLLGPAHRVVLRGLALPDGDAFETPLGPIPIDAAAVRALRRLPQVTVNAQAHAFEHSLEVHLPFLQETLGQFALVPLVVGDADTEEVAEVLQLLWGGAETLIVVSSDLSHYLPYQAARHADRETAQAIAALDPRLDHLQACGATPVNGLLAIARQRSLRIELLDLRNSGDTAGDRARVVGYGAWALYEPPSAARAALAGSERESRAGPLLALARGAIANELGIGPLPSATAEFLRAPGASFVTLRAAGELRGCIGSLEARRALGDDVDHNARAAAFADPRFEPLARHEFDDVRVEVSVLSTPQPLAVGSLDELREALQPHVDGLILAYGERRATFLPQVWEALPDAADFVSELQRKAGLPAGFWNDGMRIARYTVDKYAERED